MSAAGCDAQTVNSNALMSSFQPQNVTIGTEVCPEYIRNSSFPLYVPESEISFNIVTVPSLSSITITRHQTRITLDNGNQNLSMCFIVKVDTCVICLLSNETNKFLVYRKAMIYVQGFLPAVTNLSSDVTLDCNSATLHITWIPPPTLQGVPIITNFINISHLDGGASVNSNTTNMSEYHYDASNMLGETLVIAVTPVNDAGPGDSTNVTVSLQASKYYRGHLSCT